VATALSKQLRRNNASKIILKTARLALVLPLLSNVRSRCPARIFATKRTERVSGRMKELTSSISTINGIKAPGDPRGTRWANIGKGSLAHP